VLPSITFQPIGVVRTPFRDRASAPRQPAASAGAEGTIELLPGHDFEDALADLDGWDRLWVVYWFHLNDGWRPKVLPPRSAGQRRGVFSTRSPHRPNPLGLSVVRLDEIRGLSLRVRDVDMIDGTPVLDLKPYVPYADAHPGARTGWLSPLAAPPFRGGASEAPADPEPGFEVTWSARAAEEVAFLRDDLGVDLRTPIERVLSLGPQPHAYRRIKREGDGFRLAIKAWRARFLVDGRSIRVESIESGYRARDLALGDDPALAPHRRFIVRFRPGA
jgi:tRNA (adenine37-N6)-methyltransferase